MTSRVEEKKREITDVIYTSGLGNWVDGGGSHEAEPQRKLLGVGTGRYCRGRKKFQFEGFELVMSVGLSKSKAPHYFTSILTCFLPLPQV